MTWGQSKVSGVEYIYMGHLSPCSTQCHLELFDAVASILSVLRRQLVVEHIFLVPLTEALQVIQVAIQYPCLENGLA